MKLFFIGDSHIAPLAKGTGQYITDHNVGVSISARPLGSQRYLCEPFFSISDQEITFTNPNVTKYIRALPANDLHTADTVYVMSLGFHTAHFSWISKTFCHLLTRDSERWALSTSAFDAIFEEKQKFQKNLLRAMKGLSLKVVVVETPRLFESSDYVVGRNAATVKFIDNRVRETFSDFLISENIKCVRLKPSMIEDEFMLPEYRSATIGDQHHASSRLGYELASEILKEARSMLA